MNTHRFGNILYGDLFKLMIALGFFFKRFRPVKAF
jgi:hypothetical protein